MCKFKKEKINKKTKNQVWLYWLHPFKPGFFFLTYDHLLIYIVCDNILSAFSKNVLRI